MKKLSVFVLSVPFVAVVAKLYYKLTEYIFDMVLKRGDKLFLAKGDVLKKEEETLQKDMEKHKDTLDIWKRKTRQTKCFVRGTGNKAVYLKIFLQNSFTHKWVAVIHGYGGSGPLMYYAAKEFYERGFNVVVPDLRGHGNSSGGFIDMGWYDRLDIAEIANKIVKGDKDAEIFLYGVSMGGAAVLMAGGEDLPHNVKGIISDCSYDSVENIFSYQISRLFKLPPFPFVKTMSKICRKKLGFDFSKASVVKQLEKCTLPVLFFHGEKDRLVPTNMVYSLYAGAKGYKDVYIIKNAEHGVSSMVDHKYYWSKVFDFTNKFGKKEDIMLKAQGM